MSRRRTRALQCVDAHVATARRLRSRFFLDIISFRGVGSRGKNGDTPAEGPPTASHRHRCKRFPPFTLHFVLNKCRNSPALRSHRKVDDPCALSAALERCSCKMGRSLYCLANIYTLSFNHAGERTGMGHCCFADVFGAFSLTLIFRFTNIQCAEK